MTAHETEQDALLQTFAEQMAKRDADYMQAYDRFVRATNQKTEALIAMGRAGFDGWGGVAHKRGKRNDVNQQCNL